MDARYGQDGIHFRLESGKHEWFTSQILPTEWVIGHNLQNLLKPIVTYYNSPIMTNMAVTGDKILGLKTWTIDFLLLRAAL